MSILIGKFFSKNKNIQMRKICFVLLFLSAFSVYPQSKEQLLQARIDSLLSDKFFQSTQIAIDVYDLTTGVTLYEKNEKLLLKPASNLKILTTSSALNYLGLLYNFKTSVFYTGGIVNGTLYGDLYVVGGCDPDFSEYDLDSLVTMVAQAGIKNISGNLIGDVSMMDSLFWGKGWMWDDDPSTDAPYLTPLVINENSIGVIVKPARTGEEPVVTLVPETDYFNIENNAVTVPADSPQTVSVNRDWIERKNTLIINGNIRNHVIPDSLTDTLRVNVYNPAMFFIELFKEALNKKDIGFKGKIFLADTPDYARELYTFNRPLKEIIQGINKKSYNLGAEMLLYVMAAKYFGKPATAANGVKMVDSLISGIGMEPNAYRIVDGSGVSHYNLVSAELLLSVLKFIYYQKPEIFNSIYSSLPVAGVDGTLKKRMLNTAAEGNVHAKTGSLSGVSSLAGYLKNKNNNLIAFSIMIENFVGSSKTARDFQDKICNLLIGY